MLEQDSLRLTYIGGPTALIELAGLRFLTDPTFDPAGTEYPTPVYVLRKTGSPSVAADRIGPVDAVLLSHDHHFDNLDRAGRELLTRARRVLTTRAGAERLGLPASGMEPWDTIELSGPAGTRVRVTATPARHGPPGGDRGPVIGFLLQPETGPACYVSGDTVWYEGSAEVAHRASIGVAILFLGAARVREVGPDHLTMTAAEAVEAARALGDATIVPLHFEGWAHFSQSRAEVEAAFESAGLGRRLVWPEPGRPIELRRGG